MMGNSSTNIDKKEITSHVKSLIIKRPQHVTYKKNQQVLVFHNCKQFYWLILILREVNNKFVSTINGNKAKMVDKRRCSQWIYTNAFKVLEIEDNYSNLKVFPLQDQLKNSN